jgi:hypothetical protein
MSSSFWITKTDGESKFESADLVIKKMKAPTQGCFSRAVVTGPGERFEI